MLLTAAETTSVELSDVLRAATTTPLPIAARILVGGTLLVSGISKLLRPRVAAEAIRNFGVLRAASLGAARLVGFVEAVCGAAVIFWLSSPMPSAMSAFLFSLFAILVARSLRQGKTFSCGCLFSDRDEIGEHTLVRAALLAATASAAALASPVGALSLTRLVVAAFVAVGSGAVWALGSALVQHSTGYRRFLDDYVDWGLAAELNLITPGQGGV